MISALLTMILFLQGAEAPQATLSSENIQAVSWQIERNQWISGKPAVYPSIAAIAHVTGCVYLRIIVSTSGSVEQAAYLGGPALMEQSAYSSVKTWKFRTSEERVETVAHICFSLKDGAEAKLLASDRQAVERDPADPAKYMDLARELLASGLPDQAESAFRRALELKPDDAEAAFGLGDSLAAKGDFNGAAAAYEALVKSGDPNEAAKEYKKALRADRPSFFREEPFLHYSLGRSLELEGDKSHALKEYRAALKQMPWNPAFRDACNRLAGSS